MEMKDGKLSLHTLENAASILFKKMRVRALVPPLTLTQSGTILCPLFSHKASFTPLPKGSVDSLGSHRRQKCTQLLLVQNVDHCADFDYPGLLPHRVTPHQAEPLPDTQNTQASIRKARFHTKQRSLSTEQPHLRLLPRRAAFPRLCQSPDPNGAQSPEGALTQEN